MMLKEKIVRFCLLLLRLGMGGFFLFVAARKLLHLDQLQETIDRFAIFPETITGRKPAGTLSPGHISLKSSRVTLKYVFPFRQESHRRISMRKKRTNLQATSKG